MFFHCFQVRMTKQCTRFHRIVIGSFKKKNGFTYYLYLCSKIGLLSTYYPVVFPIVYSFQELITKWFLSLLQPLTKTKMPNLFFVVVAIWKMYEARVYLLFSNSDKHKNKNKEIWYSFFRRQLMWWKKRIFCASFLMNKKTDLWWKIVVRRN